MTHFTFQSVNDMLDENDISLMKYFYENIQYLKFTTYINAVCIRVINISLIRQACRLTVFT